MYLIKWKQAMKLIVSIALGLFIGWLHTNDLANLLPGTEEWVMSNIAREDGIVTLISLLPFAEGTVISIQVWLMVTILSTLPILLFTPFVVAIQIWSGHVRWIIYSSFLVPLFHTLVVLYYLPYFKQAHLGYALYFWNNAESHLHIFFLRIVIFIIIFIMFNKIKDRFIKHQLKK